MKEFDTIAGINITGVFPDAEAFNDTVVGAFDGTGIFADWLNEHFGWIQDVMTRANLTPSGTPDLNGASQINQAIGLSKGIPGEIMLYMGQTDPASLSDPARVLLLEGDLVLVADYQDLVNACWVGTGDNATATEFYRTDSGDTVRSDGGTHFRLPDTRGHFLRAIDGGGSVDPSGVRLAGNPQSYGVENHAHYTPSNASNASPQVRNPTTLEILAKGFDLVSLGNVDGHTVTGSALTIELFANTTDPAIFNNDNAGFTNGAGTNTGETRPINTACHFAIWY